MTMTIAQLLSMFIALASAAYSVRMSYVSRREAKRLSRHAEVISLAIQVHVFNRPEYKLLLIHRLREINQWINDNQPKSNNK